MRQKVSSLVLDIIKNQLNSFGIGVDNYFHESSLFENKAENTNKITEALDELQRKNHLYVGDDDSNTWFKSSDFGDDKDRVVIRSNGEYTYFATDIAYHKNKFDRGYETAIDVWGSDHHGYISRIEASLEGMDIDKSKLHCELIQFVSLIKDGKRASMSTRSGEFVTIDDLLDEVGKDATRYFYIARKSNQHVDFDLNLAISKTKDNPVFYIQYANARICSIVDQIDEKCDFDKVLDYSYSLDSERKIINCLAVWENTVLESAELKQPHLISNYLEKLAALFHSYYSENKIK
jgi:arginyl-tRNA synthetase